MAGEDSIATHTTPATAVRGALVARNSLLNFAAQAVPLVAAFVALPLTIRGLGASAFGVLAIVWMVLSYLSDLGFGPTTTRFTAKALGAGRPQEVGAILWSVCTLHILVGVIQGLVLAAITPWLTASLLKIPADIVGQARSCLFLLAATVPILGLARSFRGLSEAAQRFDLILCVDIPIISATYVLAALAANAGWPLLNVFSVILVSRLVSIPAYLLIARKALPGVSLRPGSQRAGLRELTTFAGWAATSSIISPLLVYLDRFVVGALLSMTAVTYYTAPYELVTRLVLIPAGILGALYPAFSHLAGQDAHDQIEHLAARSVNLVLVLLAPAMIFVLAFAHDGIALWLGPAYAADSGVAAQILIVGVLFNAAAHVPFGLLQSLGRPEVPAKFHLIELPVQLAVATLLISRFGIAGAALAWTFRTAFDAVLLFSAAARMRVLQPRSLATARLPVTIATLLILSAAALILVPTLGALSLRIVATATLVVATTLVLWSTAVPAQDRARIAALLRARLNA